MAVLRRTGIAAAGVAALALLAPALPAAAHERNHQQRPSSLLEAHLVGSLPNDAHLFAVAPGALPWMIESSEVTVRFDGQLRVDVEGLVVPVAPANGTNPIPRLAASLVCNDSVVATTPTVPFSLAGDAVINVTVAVPLRCLAPAVLLNPNGNPAVFIAATGEAR